MLEAYFVEGMPVVNNIWDDEGIAIGKTGDGEYSYRSNSNGKVYKCRTTDLFYVPDFNAGKEKCVLKTMSSFEKSINYFGSLCHNMLLGRINVDEFVLRAHEMECPNGVGDNAPAKEYFYKMKEAFAGVLNARLKELAAQEEFVTSICGDATKANKGLGTSASYGKYKDEFIKFLLDKGLISKDEAKTLDIRGIRSTCISAYLSFGEFFVTHDINEAVKVRNEFGKKYRNDSVMNFNEESLYIVYGCYFPYDDMGVDDGVWPEEEVEDDEDDDDGDWDV